MQSLVHNGAGCCCHILREVLVVVLVTSSAFSLAKFGISPFRLKETDCWFALMMMMVVKLLQQKTLIVLNRSFDRCPEHHQCRQLRRSPVSFSCVWVQRLPVWPTSAAAGCCLCCCSYLSLTMTYPSRVCLANSFLFSSRSSGTRRRSGGPQRPVMHVPHRQNLLPAPLNRSAR